MNPADQSNVPETAEIGTDQAAVESNDEIETGINSTSMIIANNDLSAIPVEPMNTTMDINLGSSAGSSVSAVSSSPPSAENIQPPIIVNPADQSNVPGTAEIGTDQAAVESNDEIETGIGSEIGTGQAAVELNDEIETGIGSEIGTGQAAVESNDEIETGINSTSTITANNCLSTIPVEPMNTTMDNNLGPSAGSSVSAFASWNLSSNNIWLTSQAPRRPRSRRIPLREWVYKYFKSRKKLIRQHTTLSTYRSPIYKRGQPKPKDVNCVVCLNKICNDQRIRGLKCLHLSHTRCIFKWLKTEDTCPACRTRFDVDQTEFTMNDNSNGNLDDQPMQDDQDGNDNNQVLDDMADDMADDGAGANNDNTGGV